MEPSGKGFLKVTGILLIIIGALSLLGGILTVFGAAVSSSMTSSPEYQQALEAYGVSISSEEMASLMKMTLIIGIKSIVLSLVNLIAGIMAVRGCGNVEKGKQLKTVGIIALVLNALNMLYSITNGILNVIIPLVCVILGVLYIMGASRNIQEKDLLLSENQGEESQSEQSDN